MIRAVSHPQVQSPAPWPCRSEQVCAPTARSDAARGCCRAQISARVPRSEPWTLPWRFPHKQVPPYTTMGHQTAPQPWGHTALGLKQAEDGKFGGMAEKMITLCSKADPPSADITHRQKSQSCTDWKHNTQH